MPGKMRIDGDSREKKAARSSTKSGGFFHLNKNETPPTTTDKPYTLPSPTSHLILTDSTPLEAINCLEQGRACALSAETTTYCY